MIRLSFSFFKVSDRCSQGFYYSFIRKSTFLLNIWNSKGAWILQLLELVVQVFFFFVFFLKLVLD